MPNPPNVRTRRARRAVIAASAAALLAGTLASAAPAGADEVPVTDATFTWGVSGYAQQGVFGPWNFKDLGGGAELLVGSIGGGTQSDYVVAPQPATSMPVSNPQKTPNAVRFRGGTGTIDPDTGEGQLSFTGTYTINAYPAQFNAPDEVYADPVVTVGADGSGSVSMHVEIGAGIDQGGNPTPAVDLGRLPVMTFDVGSMSDRTPTSVRVTPDYQGVVNDAVEQDTSCVAEGGATGWWGSWPPAYVNALPSSVQPHFYSTGCGGSQDRKPPLPFDVTFVLADVGDPSGAAQELQVEVPEAGEPGALVWAIDGTNDLVDLGEAVANGDHRLADGTINPVRVTDTRAGGQPWSIAASVSDFTTGGTTFDGEHLGWTPSVVEAGAGAVAGPPVASGFDGGDGLKAASTLARAEAGHPTGTALLGADLQLKVPADVEPGTYTATLTLTALS